MDYLSEGPKRKKRKFHGHWSSFRINHSQWHPDDDYILINSVLHLMNISYVYYGVKFSKPYQERDIERRWKELLFNESRSSLALEAIRNIPLYDKDILDQKIPFNEAENQKLTNITFNDIFYIPNASFPSNPSLEPFVELLQEDKCGTFCRNRTPEQLYKAWITLRKHINETVKLGGDPHKFEDVDMLVRRLQDSVPLAPSAAAAAATAAVVGAGDQQSHGDYKSFQRAFGLLGHKMMTADLMVGPGATAVGGLTSGAAASVGGGGSSAATAAVAKLTALRPLSTRSSSLDDQLLANEIAESDKQHRRLLYGQLRSVGEEALRWTCLVEAVTERPIIDRQGKNSLATMTGLRSRFLIKEQEVTFGRKTATIKPDIDLSLEGPASRISRLQGCIRLGESGTFFLVNWGKEPIFVDGTVVLTKEQLGLKNDAMITVSGLTFRFNDHRAEPGSCLDEASGDVEPVYKDSNMDVAEGIERAADDGTEEGIRGLRVPSAMHRPCSDSTANRTTSSHDLTRRKQILR